MLLLAVAAWCLCLTLLVLLLVVAACCLLLLLVVAACYPVELSGSLHQLHSCVFPCPMQVDECSACWLPHAWLGDLQFGQLARERGSFGGWSACSSALLDPAVHRLGSVCLRVCWWWCFVRYVCACVWLQALCQAWLRPCLSLPTLRHRGLRPVREPSARRLALHPGCGCLHPVH